MVPLSVRCDFCLAHSEARQDLLDGVVREQEYFKLRSILEDRAI